MHVLHLAHLYWPVPSGSGAVFYEIGERLAREGHRVTVLTTDAFDLEHLWLKGRRRVAEPEATHNGVRVVRFPVWRLPGPPQTYPALRRLMVELSRVPMSRRLVLPLLRRLATLTPRLPAMARYLEHTPDLADVALVHSTNITLDFAILPLLAWAERRSIPHICTPFVHLGEPDNRRILRYYSMPHQIDILKRSAAVIAQTGLEQRFLARQGIPENQIHTIGVGVNPEQVSGGNGERFRHEHNLEGPIVLTVGVAAHDKGTPHVVEAMQQVWQQGIAATWVQIGPLMGHFEDFLARLPADDRSRMRVLGFVPDQVKHDALAASDVFVLPSRTDSFGIVYLEAWVYGKPVIGAQAGGVPDVITHNTTGLLVPFGNPDRLAQSIGLLLRQPDLARRLGSAGRAAVLRGMTWEHKFALVRQVYHDVL